MKSVWSGRAWWSYAQVRRILSGAGSAAGARNAVAGASRRNPAEWNDIVGRNHGAYRASVDPHDTPVAALCVTSRPHLLGRLLDSISCQHHPVSELVLVTNATAYDDLDVERSVASRADHLPPVRVLRRSPEVSLGACLNDAMDSTDARFVAKFDDDDLYGPFYLADSMRAHTYAGAGVVGKHSYYAFLATENRTILRFPAHEFSYSATLAGGTLVIDRQRTGSLRFADISIGEDRQFLQACLRRGVATFSADRFGFVQTRSGDNTWSIDVETFQVGAVDIGTGMAPEALER